MKYEIEVSSDRQKCAQCGKLKKGCYRQKNNNWICTKCIFKNIVAVSGDIVEQDRIALIVGKDMSKNRRR